MPSGGSTAPCNPRSSALVRSNLPHFNGSLATPSIVYPPSVTTQMPRLPLETLSSLTKCEALRRTCLKPILPHLQAASAPSGPPAMRDSTARGDTTRSCTSCRDAQGKPRQVPLVASSYSLSKGQLGVLCLAFFAPKHDDPAIPPPCHPHLDVRLFLAICPLCNPPRYHPLPCGLHFASIFNPSGSLSVNLCIPPSD